jgi:hypothetical protein
MPEIVFSMSDPVSAAASSVGVVGLDLGASSRTGVVLVVTAMAIVLGL